MNVGAFEARHDVKQRSLILEARRGITTTCPAGIETNRIWGR